MGFVRYTKQSIKDGDGASEEWDCRDKTDIAHTIAHPRCVCEMGLIDSFRLGLLKGDSFNCDAFEVQLITKELNRKFAHAQLG